ncbi:MAG: sodium:solute symporter family protein [Bdellovibrionota bacterium]|nr:sodium:solute symporter family protein [Bdellovibrionota bacterium]
MAIFQAERMRNKNKDFDWLDYLLMGRKLSLPLFVGSLVATWYGGIFGVTQIAYESGIYNFLIQGVFWYITYIIFALFLVHKISKYKSVTLAELIGKQFGPKSQKLAGIFNFFNVVPAVYTISLGILIESLTGIPFWIASSMGLIFVFFYASFGGFRAVVFTDMIQFLAMFIGVGCVFFLSLSNFGGLNYLMANLPSTHFDLSSTHGLGETLAWGFIALSTLVDPNFYQRVFAAKSPAVAKKGILLSTVFWFIFDIFTTFGAMYARAVIPEADPSNAYLVYALQLLPVGLKGLFIAGIFACILSTLDSYIFTASNTLLYDLLPNQLYKKKPLHKWGHLFVCSLSYFLAYSFQGNIKAIWKTLGSLSAACLLFPVLFQLFGKRKIGDLQFVVISLSSAVAVSFWRNLDKSSFWQNIDELYIGISVSAIGFLFSHLWNTSRKEVLQEQP